MFASVEFLLRLVECEQPAQVCAEDFLTHGGLLRACQTQGFLGSHPMAPDVPACPVCVEGTPRELGGRLLCSRCRSLLEPSGQYTWRFDPAAFLAWLARALDLRGGVRQVEPRLWHLGVWGKGGEATECFYQQAGELSALGLGRLDAYQSVIVLHGLTPLPGAAGPGLRRLALPRLLVWEDDRLSVRQLGQSDPRSLVHFETLSGTLWAGGRKLGEVPLASREYYLLECLAEHLDRYVGYGQLRREILRRSGSQDSRDAATFCHEIKRRAKRKYAPKLDSVLTTNNKAAGYRLRASLDGVC